MKTIYLLPLVTLVAATAYCEYSIPWSSIAGGGGTSTGGVYSVTGTIGQPAAGGPMTNGLFSVVGGFWVLPVAVQSSNAPILTIVAASPGYATISWSPPTPGFVLQESYDLTPAGWSNSPSGATNPVNVACSYPAHFYRLIKP